MLFVPFLSERRLLIESFASVLALSGRFCALLDFPEQGRFFHNAGDETFTHTQNVEVGRFVVH